MLPSAGSRTSTSATSPSFQTGTGFPLKRSQHLRTVLALVLLGTVLAGCEQSPAALEGEWRQWRGPGGSGISTETGLPETWTAEGTGIRWQESIPGSGNSSPIVSGGRVFLTTTYGQPDDRARRAERRKHLYYVAMGLDLESGEELWRTEIYAGRRGTKHWLTTYAAPTPVTDGTTLFAYFGRVLAALDFDGTVLWQVEVEPDHLTHLRYGVASSPLVVDDLVVLAQDREAGDSEEPGWIAAFDKATGELRWRDEWRNTCCSYTTPLVVDQGRRKLLLNSSSGEVVAYDLSTGERLWSQIHGTVQPVPSMVASEGLLVVPGGIHQKTTATMRLPAAGSAKPAEVLWKTVEGVPELSSPVLYQGILFVVTDGGVMTAYDPATGERHWRRRVGGGPYRASLVAGDGKVYAINDRGETAVVAAEPEFRLLAENKLPSGGVSASPAIAGGYLLIRTTDALYCLEAAGQPVAEQPV